jgi:hypothetical protein
MKIFKHLRLTLLIAGMSALFFQSCRDNSDQPGQPSAHDYDSEVFMRWNDLFMEIDRVAKGYRPGPAPRALAYLGLSAYESVVAGIPENNSMELALPGLDVPEADTEAEYYWPASVNESYAFLMTRFFYQIENDYPDLFGKIEQTRLSLHQQFAQETSAEVLARSEAYGRSVAEAVYAYENSDLKGRNGFLEPQPTDYVPPTGPGLWQPTFPDYGRAMFPYWGEVRTFALNEDELIARPPIPYSELPQSLFYNQAMEVYNTVKLIKDDGPGGYEQLWIGEFWSDDILGWTFSPASRLVAIGNQVVTKEKMDLAGSAELFAKLGMAMSDASVAVWNSKFLYNVERPISYIRRVVSNNEPAAGEFTSMLRHPIAGWETFTPPFPAYPSGHSGFAGAGGKILSSFFEFNSHHPGTYSFTDNCHINRTDFLGTPRTFSSFKEMADEDAYSRIPLGVHFRMDCSEGLRMGELAAQRVLELPWKR